MKKLALAAAVAGVFTFSHTATAGIPVTVVADPQAMAAQIQNYAQMLKDYATLMDQLNTAKDQLDNISGVRGLAGVISSTYDTGVSVDPNAVLTTFGIKGSGDHGLTGDVASVFDAGNQNTATWYAQSEKSLNQAKARFSQLSGLIAEVNNSPDQKDILDLQARIGAEEVMLQNEMAKLSMLRSQAEATQAVREQQIQQMAVESSGELRTVSW